MFTKIFSLSDGDIDYRSTLKNTLDSSDYS